ncbi:MAG TPA: YkvA family protein [Bauldia sp.]|nr:YkvA family protein [Bauldia sp.]
MSDIKYGEILPPEDDAAREERVRGRFWATFRKAARRIPFADDLVAAYYCALDPETPHRVRAVLLAALAYFVLPLDAIPDILAGIGFTDDMTVLVATIAMVRSHITPVHREAARRALADDPSAPAADGVT